MKHQIVKTLSVLFFLLLAISGSISIVHAQTPQETFTQYISDLQKNPNDYALREKIIKLVQEMGQNPAIPREAERFMNRGAAAVKSAKDANDFKDAVAEFEKATMAAPWLANAYYNLGVAQDGAGMYTEAIKSLKLYLLAVPNASDAKKLIYEIEYRKEKAAKESSPAAIAEKKRETEEDFIKKLNGVRYVLNHNLAPFPQNTLDIRGNKIIKGTICRGCTKGLYSDGAWHFEDETTLNGHEFSLYFGGRSVCDFDLNYKAVENGKISDDGNTITTELCNKTYIYRRER